MATQSEPKKTPETEDKKEPKGEPKIERATIPLWPDAGRRLGLGRAATYGAYHAGDLPVKVIKIGKKLLVLKAEMDRLVA